MFSRGVATSPAIRVAVRCWMSSLRLGVPDIGMHTIVRQRGAPVPGVSTAGTCVTYSDGYAQILILRSDGDP
ncbi:hypothetical protein GCM10009601_00840 [Streptomyces thermospinosisporus]|uniref:Uncharacterized protein n=1 Tax=Streptomyces thermospinosisporus TaxID=161482 RepID=A0ABN1YHW5_9ACTN